LNILEKAQLQIWDLGEPSVGVGLQISLHDTTSFRYAFTLRQTTRFATSFSSKCDRVSKQTPTRQISEKAYPWVYGIASLLEVLRNVTLWKKKCLLLSRYLRMTINPKFTFQFSVNQLIYINVTHVLESDYRIDMCSTHRGLHGKEISDIKSRILQIS
jgi:hypothetical protein